MCATRSCFRHEILEYGTGSDGFVRAVLPHVARAVAVQRPVMVAARSRRLEALREALGEDRARVGYRDTPSLAGNPARIIQAWREFLHSGEQQLGMLGVSEQVWIGRSPAALEECRRHESLLNLAFAAGAPWRLICPYDVDELEEDVIEHARRSHPYAAGEDASGARNELYAGPPASAELLGGELPAPAGEVREIAFEATDLSSLRGAVADWARGHELAATPAEELVLAVNELASNSVRYGGGQGALRMWREGSELMCEVRDEGRIADPLVGRVRPELDRRSGRGLWIVNQLCDLVQIRSSRAGTAIRVHKLLDG